MNVFEKVTEQVLEKQMLDFVNSNNLLDKIMHGLCEKHSVVTTKLEIDEEIN